MYRDFSTKNIESAVKKIGKVIRKIDINDVDGFRNSMIELNKLGFIWQLEPMLNILYQNKKMIPAMKFKKQQGSKADLAPNLRGDLKEGEAALSKQNAEEVLLKYATAKGISLADAKKANLSEVNKWLADDENAVHIFIARSPIPHAGGAMLVRVKRLFGRNGLIELHHNDVFRRLEGDFDGDWVTIEMLPYTYDKETGFSSSIEDAFTTFFDNLKIEGISLDKFDNDLGKVLLSNRSDRIRLIEAMTYNKQGEIVNVQSVYGLLVNTVDSIDIKGVGQVLIKQPDEKVPFNVAKINGKSPKLTVATIFRMFLQAAVDNSKYMLLQQWKYNQQNLMMSIFKYGKGHPREGKSISREDYNKYIKPWIKKVLYKPNQIRKGEDFEYGKYTLKKTIEESEVYMIYSEDKNTFIQGLGLDIHVNFKDIGLTPVEEVAVAPYKHYMIWMQKNDIVGTVGSPIFLHYAIRRNAHDRAVDFLNSPEVYQDIVNRAMIKDLGKDYSKKDNKGWMKKQIKLGKDYAQKMADGYYTMLNRDNYDNPNFLERDERARIWRNNSDKEYKNLSELAKVVATYQFLNGLAKTQEAFADRGDRAPMWLPPASNLKTETQLLHEEIMSKFAEVYNDEVANNRDMNERFKREEDMLLEEYIEKIC